MPRITCILNGLNISIPFFCCTEAAQYYHKGKHEITFNKAGKEVKSTVDKEVDSQMETYFSNARSRIKRKTQKNTTAPPLPDMNESNDRILDNSAPGDP